MAKTPPPSQKRPLALLILGALLLCVTPLLWVATRPGTYVGDGTDAFSYQLPLRTAAAQALQAGHWFFWNPVMLGGIPGHAGLQLGLLYPPNLVSMLLTGGQSLLPLWVFHVLLLGAGGALLARVHLGRAWQGEPWPLVGSAAVWMGSGATWGHLFAGHVSFVEAWALFPWLWAGTLHAWRTRSLVWAIASGVVLGVQVLAGHPQVTAFGIVGAVGLLLSHALGDAPEETPAGPLRAWPGTLVALLVLAVMGAVAAALAAAQLVPTAAIAGDLNRTLMTPRETATAFAEPAASLWTFFSPHVWGGPGHKVSDIGYHEASAWLGACGLGLALVGGLRTRTRGGVLLAVAGLTLTLSAGQDSPVLLALVDLVPGLGTFRAPSRWLIVAHGLFAVLAADALAGPPPKSAGKGVATPSTEPAWPGAALWVVALVPLYLRITLHLDHGWWGSWVAGKVAKGDPLVATVQAELLWSALVLSALGWLYQRPGLRHRALPVLAGLCVLESTWLAAQHVGPTTVQDVHITAWSDADAARLQDLIPPSQRLVTAPALRLTNWSPGGVVRNVGGYEPAVTKEANWYANLMSSRGADGYAIMFQARTPSDWVDRMAASHLVVDARDQKTKRRFASWPKVETLPSGREVLRNPAPIARVAWADEIVVEPDAKTAITRLGNLTHATVLLSQALPHQPGAGGPLRLRPESPDVVEVEAEASAPAVLVLRDAQSRGWVATVDGQVQPEVRADGLFRAVSVPAGRHTVSWRYTPPGWEMGRTISAIAWLVVLALLAGAWVRARQTAR